MNHKLKLVASAFSILALLMATGLQGQTIRKITLQEAIDLSIINNHLLKNNSAKIDEAVAAVKEANERKLPEFTISGSWLYLPITPNISLKTNSNNNGGGSPSVSQAMYSTTNLSLPLLDRLDGILYDSKVRLNAIPGVDPRIVIVDIDEKSLQEREMGGEGRWPWPRDRLALLVNRDT